MAELEYDHTFLTDLHRKLNRHFDEEELRTLCFNLQVEYDTLSAQGKANKSREFVNYLARRGRIHDLVVKVIKERPSVNWGHVKTDTTAPVVTREFVMIKFPANPIAVLMAKSGTREGEWIFITEQTRRILIGRDDFADVTIKEPYFSRHHLSIVVTREEEPNPKHRPYRVEVWDHGTGNGTIINGNQIRGNIQLQDGDIIELGVSTFQYVWLYDQIQKD